MHGEFSHRLAVRRESARRIECTELREQCCCLCEMMRGRLIQEAERTGILDAPPREIEREWRKVSGEDLGCRDTGRGALLLQPSRGGNTRRAPGVLRVRGAGPRWQARPEP